MNQKDVERAKAIEKAMAVLTEKIEKFKELADSCNFPFPKGEAIEFAEALGVAIACMELQVAKKPKSREDEDYNEYIACPSCGHYELKLIDFFGNVVHEMPYCYCGQKLDWQEDSDE